MKLLSMIHLWNTWILVIPVWLAGILIAGANRSGMKRAVDMSWYSPLDRIASWGSMMCMIAFMVATLFMRLDTHSIRLYAGILLVLVGFSVHLAAKYSFSNTPSGAAITGGIYRYSRNPMYVSFSLVMFGAVTASASLLLFCVWVLTAVCTHLLILGEERYCLKTYGSVFGSYMKKTPRYVLFF